MPLNKRRGMRIPDTLHVGVRSREELLARFYHRVQVILTAAVPHGENEMYAMNQCRRPLKSPLNQGSEAQRCQPGEERRTQRTQHLRERGHRARRRPRAESRPARCGGLAEATRWFRRAFSGLPRCVSGAPRRA